METMDVVTRFEKDAKWLEKEYEELKRKYDGEWVAVFNERIVGHDKSMERLMGRLEAGYPEDFRNIFIEYVTKKGVEMIL